MNEGLRPAQDAMPSLRLFVSDEIQARLDALAPDYGGRTALLRVLLQSAVQRIDPLPAPKGRPLRTFVRLSAEETKAVIAQAASRGLKVSTWIRTLVRRRVFGEPRFLRSEELALYAIHDRLGEIARELQRINLQPAPRGEVEAQISRARTEVWAAVKGLRRAFEGNLSYWEASFGDEPHARL
ncbi:MAG: hypothetical protein IT546_06010 [Caulobacteraceae bacterium]|nr:hypothetical protein [Caulobacteraceae bacterium]